MPDLSALTAVFTARLETRDGEPAFVVPDRELELGNLTVDKTYRVAIVDRDGTGNSAQTATAIANAPPVAVGERLTVEIEDIGEQGDGIARVGPGYIVFIEEANLGDELEIEITSVQESFAFAEPVGEDDPADKR